MLKKHENIPITAQDLFPPVLEIQPEIGSYRLPTHRRDAHRKFFR